MGIFKINDQIIVPAAYPFGYANGKRPGWKRAKSTIFDFLDHWGGSYMNIRAIDFFLKGVLITHVSNFTAYATSTINGWLPANAFNTNLSKTGEYANSWLSNYIGTNQRLIIVHNELTDYDSIAIHNGHHYGGHTYTGAKNFKAYLSTDAITSVVCGSAISNSAMLFDGQLRQHVASDVADPQFLELI